MHDEERPDEVGMQSTWPPVQNKQDFFRRVILVAHRFGRPYETAYASVQEAASAAANLADASPVEIRDGDRLVWRFNGISPATPDSNLRDLDALR